MKSLNFWPGRKNTDNPKSQAFNAELSAGLASRKFSGFTSLGPGQGTRLRLTVSHRTLRCRGACRGVGEVWQQGSSGRAVLSI